VQATAEISDRHPTIGQARDVPGMQTDPLAEDPADRYRTAGVDSRR
jgi:hypothetical protein